MILEADLPPMLAEPTAVRAQYRDMFNVLLAETHDEPLWRRQHYEPAALTVLRRHRDMLWWLYLSGQEIRDLLEHEWVGELLRRCPRLGTYRPSPWQERTLARYGIQHDELTAEMAHALLSHVLRVARVFA